jgi:NAD(P)-dependent dehydrogenase (short-subunit alcohol dehydrogenase family)
MKLKDKVAIVTGAAQGIGRECALRFVKKVPRSPSLIPF